MTILKFHDFSRFSMSVRTLNRSVGKGVEVVKTGWTLDTEWPAGDRQTDHLFDVEEC